MLLLLVCFLVLTSLEALEMSSDMQSYFYELADSLSIALKGQELFTSTLESEESNFCRLNGGKVRQAGTVRQTQMALTLIDGRRHGEAALTLTGIRSADSSRLEQLLKTLREQIKELPEDPYLLYATTVKSSERRQKSKLPDGRETVDKITQSAKGRDLVGIYAAGGIFRGFANSLGQKNWFETFNFNFDFSYYLRADKAVKSSYAGFTWSDEDYQSKVELAQRELAVLDKEPHTMKPGRYRVYIAPQAFGEVTDMLCWGGFSLKAQKTKQTPLLKMVDEGYEMNKAVTFKENTADGVAPDFNDAGFTKPASVTLIEAGRYRDALVSPRSAQEYKVETNGANAGEGPQSMDVGAGKLQRNQVLKELGTGVFINNLWYLNFSDKPACRVTGMTRFASFWVEKGEVIAPLNVMRFDENVIKMLGGQLVDFTSERDLILSASTYGQRATSSQRLPGALIDNFSFTL
jgi:predicted Zn-dependent protease